MRTDQIKTNLGILNFIEMIMCVITTGLVANDVLIGKNLIEHDFILITVVGFLLIHCFILVGYLIDAPIRPRLRIVIDVVGTAFWCASGAIIIDQFKSFSSTFEKQMAGGSFAVIQAAIYVVDIFLCNKEEKTIK